MRVRYDVTAHLEIDGVEYPYQEREGFMPGGTMSLVIPDALKAVLDPDGPRLIAVVHGLRQYCPSPEFVTLTRAPISVGHQVQNEHGVWHVHSYREGVRVVRVERVLLAQKEG